MNNYEIMEMSIQKNIQELSEMLVDYGLADAYDLIDLVNKYMKYLIQQNKTAEK